MKYTLIRESCWMSSGCDCCEDTDIGIVYIKDENDEYLMYGGDNPQARGFSDEQDALEYLLSRHGVDIYIEDNTDYEERYETDFE